MEMMKNDVILFFIIFTSCTSNPFWDDPNRTEMKISGQVIAENNVTDVPVSIWLETLDLFTITDSNGNFSIPIANSQTVEGNLNGPLKLYFYIHNYTLDSVTIYFTNGLFSREQIDFFDSGKLINSKILKKIMSGNLLLNFNKNILENNDTLKVIVNLNFHNDASLESYKYIYHGDGSDFHSGLFFRNILNNEIILNQFIGQDSYGNNIKDQLVVIDYNKNETVTWIYQINTDSLNIIQGEYEVLPYILVNQNGLPSGMKDALGGDSLFMRHDNYLDLPFDFSPDTLVFN